MAKVELRPVNRQLVSFRIVGTSPLIQHAWAEKAKQMMRDKQAGKKTKSREVRDAEAEMSAAMYVTDDGRPGISGMAFKKAMITAAHKDIGIEKTMVRKAVYLVTDDSDKVLPFATFSEPRCREDMVRVGAGSADLRYRPQFDEWTVDITLEVDGDLLQVDDVLNLVRRAGFGVGIHEWRPEKDGEFGRFEVCDKTSVNVESV